jgi:hypothetical protein
MVRCCYQDITSEQTRSAGRHRHIMGCSVVHTAQQWPSSNSARGDTALPSKTTMTACVLLAGLRVAATVHCCTSSAAARHSGAGFGTAAQCPSGASRGAALVHAAPHDWDASSPQPAAAAYLCVPGSSRLRRLALLLDAAPLTPTGAKGGPRLPCKRRAAHPPPVPLSPDGAA